MSKKFYEKNIHFMPFTFKKIHNVCGSCVEKVRNKKEDDYYRGVVAFVSTLFDPNDFYNMNINENILNFMNDYITFNKNNSVYENVTDNNPYAPTIGIFDREKHSIFDSLLLLGYVLINFHRNECYKKIF